MRTKGEVLVTLLLAMLALILLITACQPQEGSLLGKFQAQRVNEEDVLSNVASATVSVTEVPVFPTTTPFPVATAAGPGFVVLDDSVGRASYELLSIEDFLVAIPPEEEILILTGGSEATFSESISADVLLAEDGVPYAEAVRYTPCQGNYGLTQGFFYSYGMDWQTAGYHPGLDIVCYGDKVLVAMADCVVIARYDIPLRDQKSVDFWVSGYTTLCLANVATKIISPEIVNALGITTDYVPIINVVGHMAPGGNWPGVGSTLKMGQSQIGVMGASGRVTGPHVHQAWYIKLAGGGLYAIHPETGFVSFAN